MNDEGKKTIGIPLQDTYTGEEIAELFKEGFFSRGTYMIDCDGNGNYKISRLQKQWIQKH